MKQQLFLGVLLLFGSLSPPAIADGLEGVVLLATDPAEHLAVVRVGDRELQVLGPGKLIEGTGATLERVLADRVVVREAPVGPRRQRRVAWIYLHNRAAGGSKIRYLERSAEAPATARLPRDEAPDE